MKLWETLDTPPLRILREEVDAVLERLLTHPPTHVPAPIREAMRYATLNGGKRLRALMLVRLTEALNGPKADALLAGAAVELVHAASLILDDMPFMDDATVRRGRPALHRVYGLDGAILTAFALVNLAYEVLARLPSIPPETTLNILHDLAFSIGRAGLIAGQWQDLHPESWNRETLEFIHQYKTAVMFEFVAAAAGSLSRVSAMELESLRQFGRIYGQSYQLLDDLLDVLASVTETGKAHQGTRRLTSWRVLAWPEVFQRIEVLLNEAHRIATGARWFAMAQVFIEPLMINVRVLAQRRRDIPTSEDPTP